MFQLWTGLLVYLPGVAGPNVLQHTDNCENIRAAARKKMFCINFIIFILLSQPLINSKFANFKFTGQITRSWKLTTSTARHKTTRMKPKCESQRFLRMCLWNRTHNMFHYSHMAVPRSSPPLEFPRNCADFQASTEWNSQLHITFSDCVNISSYIPEYILTL